VFRPKSISLCLFESRGTRVGIPRIPPAFISIDQEAIVGCNTTSNKYMYFQAASDAGPVSYIINNLKGAEAVSEFVFEYFGSGPLNAQNATILMFTMARKLFNNLASYTTVLGQDGSIPTPFLRYSLVGGATPVSYIQLVYSGIIAIIKVSHLNRYP
jgi:hypothetical protein